MELFLLKLFQLRQHILLHNTLHSTITMQPKGINYMHEIPISEIAQ